MADYSEAFERPKTPVWFWILGAVALIWNSFGAMDFTMTQLMPARYLAQFSEEQRAFYLGFPLWYVLVWGVATWSAVIASLGLLLRTRFAAPLFLVSIACFILSAIYLYGFAGALALEGGLFGVIFSLVIFLSLIAFWRVARWGVSAGILR
jgi:uncharacterized membrane protein